MSCNNCKRLAEEIELGTVTVENLNKDIIKLDEELDRVDYEKSQLQAENQHQTEQIAELFHLLMQAEPWLCELTSSVDSVSLEELMPLVNDIQALKGQDNENT